MALGDVEERGSDAFRVARLARELGGGLERFQLLRGYMNGMVEVEDGTADAGRQLEAYRRFLRLSRLNFAELVVTAATSRVKALGFETTTPGDSEGDAAALRLWRDSNGMVVLKQIVEDMGVFGSGYGIVAQSEDGPVFLRGELWNTVAVKDSLRPWLSAYALHYAWLEDDGMEVLTLFVPGGQRRAYREADGPSLTEDSDSWLFDADDWDWLDAATVRLGWTERVPVVPAYAKDGIGQFERHTDTLDRINHSIFQRLTISAMQAFRQRALTGDLPDVYPEGHALAGQKIPYDEILKAGPLALWRLPEGVEIWESSVTDIGPLINAISADVKYLAAVTKTPLYLLSTDAQAGSAQGASLARETLVSRVEDLCTYADAFMSHVMRLLFEADGSARSDRVTTVWAPADRPSMMEKAQAASQVKGVLPNRTIWREIFQFTPEQVAQAEQDEWDSAFASGGLDGDGFGVDAAGGGEAGASVGVADRGDSAVGVERVGEFDAPPVVG